MVHSIELFFDDDTDAAIRRGWTALADAGLPSQVNVRSASNRPHVTLIVADHIDAAADPMLAGLADRLPLPCRVGALMFFGSTAFTLVRQIVPSAGLLALHAEVDRLCAAHRTSALAPHSRPGQWTPHATLCRRLKAVDVLTGLEALADSAADIDGTFVGLRHWDGDDRVEHVLIS